MTHDHEPDQGVDNPLETWAIERGPVQHVLADQLAVLVGELDVESDTTRRKLSRGGLSRASQAQRMLERAERVMEVSLACDRAQGMSWSAIATMTGRPAEALRERYGQGVEVLLAAIRESAPVKDLGAAWIPSVPRREYRGEDYLGPDDPEIPRPGQRAAPEPTSSDLDRSESAP